MTQPRPASEPAHRFDAALSAPLSNIMSEVVEAQRAWTASWVADSQLGVGAIGQQVAAMQGARLGSLVADSQLQLGLGGIGQQVAAMQGARLGSLVADSQLQLGLGAIGQQVAAMQAARLGSLVADSQLTVRGLPSQLLPGQWSGIDTYASVSLGRITQSAKSLSSTDADQLARRIGRVSSERISAHPEVADLASVLDADDAVDRLLESENLAAAVESIVQSDLVEELLASLDHGALREGAASSFEHVTGVVAARDHSLNRLTPAQTITIFTSLELLIVAAVLRFYGYDIGAVADVIAWGLAPPAVYGYAILLGKKDQ